MDIDGMTCIKNECGWMIEGLKRNTTGTEDHLLDVIEHLRAENERLREAGNQIVAAFDEGTLNAGDLYAMRAALAEKGDV